MNVKRQQFRGDMLPLVMTRGNMLKKTETFLDACSGSKLKKSFPHSLFQRDPQPPPAQHRVPVRPDVPGPGQHGDRNSLSKQSLVLQPFRAERHVHFAPGFHLQVSLENKNEVFCHLK